MKPLLDTHIFLWWMEGSSRLSKAQREVLDSASAKNPLWVSDITLWEIATLVSLGRLLPQKPLRAWLEEATAPPLVKRVGISPEIAAEVAGLPDSLHRDPADRVLIATARVLGALLLTQDQKILAANLTATLS